MKRLCSLLFILITLSAGSALAQWAKFPTGGLDSRTVRTQAKVDELYERGDYKRAHFIYSNELSRQGDKYAQYMTGYMYMMGQGVEEDRVRASAWYRIAAERRAPEFMAVRDQVLRTLTDDQRKRSDELYVALRKEYSDLVIVMGLLVEDLDNMTIARTGSRLAVNSNSVVIIDMDSGMPVSAASQRNRDTRTAQMRLDFVTARLDIDPIKADQADEELDLLWERIQDHLSVVDDATEGLYASP